MYVHINYHDRAYMHHICMSVFDCFWSFLLAASKLKLGSVVLGDPWNIVACHGH